MEVKIKQGSEMLDATIEMVDGVMVVSPKEVEFKPKDGDVVKSNDAIWIFSSLRNCGTFNAHAVLLDGSLFFTKPVYCEEISPATEEEKQRLFEKLEEEGYEWKAETKELVKLKWRPKLGETYFSISGSTRELCVFRPFEYKWYDDSTDNKLYELGRCFMTEEECHEFCNRLNDAINSVKP